MKLNIIQNHYAYYTSFVVVGFLLWIVFVGILFVENLAVIPMVSNQARYSIISSIISQFFDKNPIFVLLSFVQASLQSYIILASIQSLRVRVRGIASSGASITLTSITGACFSCGSSLFLAMGNTLGGVGLFLVSPFGGILLLAISSVFLTFVAYTIHRANKKPICTSGFAG